MATKQTGRFEMTAAEVAVGDLVFTAEGDGFVVAGIRRNPDDERRVRFFSDDNVMRVELEPEDQVEVER